jgi:hypothetical protein
MKPSATLSAWDALHPDALQILRSAEEALRRIDRHETFHGWLEIARGVATQREAAMTIAGTDDVNAYAYRVAWREGMTRYPELAKLNKTERSHAVWLWDNHDGLEAWHRALKPNQARAFNHPSTIWRKNPLGEYREKRTRTSRPAAADMFKDAANHFEEVLERVEVATAVNPGLDLSTSEMIEASGRTLVDYYGAKQTAALIRAVVPLVAGSDRIESKPELFDMSPELIGESAKNFVEVYGAGDTRRFSTALRALVAPPAAPDAGSELDTGDARAALKELATVLRTVTRLDPAGVAAALRPHLEALEAEGRKNMATTAGPSAVPHRVHEIERCLADWQRLGIKGGSALARQCRAPLTALRDLRKGHRSGAVWANDKIAQTAELAAQLKDRIEQWAMAAAGGCLPEAAGSSRNPGSKPGLPAKPGRGRIAEGGGARG